MTGAETSLNMGVAEIVAYLGTSGWEVSADGPLAQLWQHTRDEDAKILVPLRESAPDYPKRIHVLLEEIATHEERNVATVRDAITRVFHDVANLRALHPQHIDDSIPLHAGTQLFASAKRMVVAAAGATIRRQGHFGRSMPEQAREHAHHVRLGQTQRGSYILPIISQARPVGPVQDDEELVLDIAVEESLFDRRVMATMAGALKTLESMAVRSDRLPSTSDIADSVGEGVSRELCTALYGVLTSETVAKLDVTFDWSSATLPPPRAARQVDFPKESEEVISRIAEELRNLPREREHVLFGLITDLHRDSDAPSGRVGMETIVDRRPRTVWFDLSEEDYRFAVHCHDTRQRVAVRGLLRVAPGESARMEVSQFATDESLGRQK